MKKLLLAAALAFPMSTAGMTSNEMVELCDKNETGCMLFVTGVSDGVIASLFQLEMPTLIPFCFPDGATARQLTKVVLKWLEIHSELLHSPASFNVLTSLTMAFPRSEGDQCYE